MVFARAAGHARLSFLGIPEPYTIVLNLMDNVKHLGDGRGPTLQQAPLQLLRLVLICLHRLSDVKVCSLVVLDLLNVVGNFLGFHDPPDSPPLHDGPYLLQ